MLSREDFVFTIGYDGPTAVVDKQAKKKYGKLSTKELVEKGLYRAAYSSAVYSKESSELRYVVDSYTSLGDPSAGAGAGAGAGVGAGAGEAPLSREDLTEAERSAMDRLFGVFLVDVKRSISL